MEEGKKRKKGGGRSGERGWEENHSDSEPPSLLRAAGLLQLRDQGRGFGQGSPLPHGTGPRSSLASSRLLRKASGTGWQNPLTAWPPALCKVWQWSQSMHLGAGPGSREQVTWRRGSPIVCPSILSISILFYSVAVLCWTGGLKVRPDQSPCWSGADRV